MFNDLREILSPLNVEELTALEEVFFEAAMDVANARVDRLYSRDMTVEIASLHVSVSDALLDAVKP